MKPTLVLLLVAVAVVLQISETRFVKKDVDVAHQNDAVAAEEMAAAGGYERIARDAANPFAKFARSTRWCCPCCDYRCNPRRQCSCCLA